MELTSELNIPLLVFVDSDLKSIEPWWFERLTTPIIEKKASYVTPFYVRHKYDGTITNNICYPLTTALYGEKIRQPIGGDFGVSLEVIKKYLAKPVDWWSGDIGRFGIDIFMTTVAINESKYGVMQAALGAKIHDAKDPGEDLGPMFSQVVGTLFKLMEVYKDNWKCDKEIQMAEIYGEIPEVEVKPIKVNFDNLIAKSRSTVAEYENYYKDNLSEEIFNSIINSNGMIEVELWAKIIFKFEELFTNSENKEEVISALIPLYYSRVADFVNRTMNMTTNDTEVSAEF